MRKDNIAYDDSTSTLGFITEQVFLGTAMWAGVSLITDPHGFKETIQNVGKKVFPEVAPDLGAYDTELSNMQTVLKSTSKTRAINMPKDTSARLAAMRATNQPIKPESIIKPSLSSVSSVGDRATSFAKKGFKYEKIEEITDITGKNIGVNIRKALDALPLNIQSGVKFNGTKAIIPYKDLNGNERDFQIHFSKLDTEGNNIVRNGNAFYTAPATYKYGINPTTKQLTGNIIVQDHNTHILELLKDKEKVYRLAAKSEELKHNVPTDVYNRILKRSGFNNSLETTMNELRTVDYGRVLKMALKVYQGEPTWAPPGGKIAVAKQSGTLRVDSAQLSEIGAEYPGFDIFQLGKTPAKPNWSTLKKRSATGANIKLRHTVAQNAAPGQILFNDMPLDHPLLANVQFANDLKSGLTSNLSQSQSAKGTMYAGGQMYSPAQTEGWKTVSDFGWRRRFNKGEAWRMTPRYRATEGTAGRVSNAVADGRGMMNSFGYINFAGDEEIMFNTSMASKLDVEVPVQVGFKGFTKDLESQAIKVKPVGGGKSIPFTLGDLTNGKKDLYDYFVGENADKYELHFPTNFTIGVKTPSKPISGIIHDGLLEDEGEYLKLKYKGFMDTQDIHNFVQMNEGNPENISMTMKMLSRVTKNGVGTTSARASISFFNLDGNLGGVSAIEELARITGRRNIESVYGPDLFKNALASFRGTELSGMKASSDLMGFAHSMIGGMVIEAAGDGQHTMLEGGIAEKFGAMLGVKPVNGKLNLTKLINKGKYTFNINGTDKAAYADQLETVMKVLGGTRSQFDTVEQGHLRITDDLVKDPNLLEGFTDKYNYAAKQWKGYVKTGVINKETFLDKRKLLFPILAANTPLEEMILSQGKNRFNTARFSMRDVGSFLGKQNILEELLSRSDSDSVQMMRESRLLDLSTFGEQGQKDLRVALGQYTKDLKDAYSHDEDAMKQISEMEMALGSSTNEELAADTRKWSGADLKIGLFREEHANVENSFLNPTRNRFGRVIRVEGGGLTFIPSAPAIGSATLLHDGNITFEKHAIPFYEMLNEASEKGFIDNNTLSNQSFRIRDAAKIMRDERAKIQIYNATYSKTINDKRIANHDVIGLFEGAGTGSEEARAVLGQMATVSRKDVQASFHYELTKAIERAKAPGHTVVEELNGMHKENHYLAENYGSIIGDLKSTSTKDDVNKAVAQMLEAEEAKSKRLMAQLDEAQRYIHKQGQGGSNLEVLMNDIVTNVTKNSMMYQIQRDPKIYSESDPVVHAFMDIGFGVSEADGMKRIGLGHVTNMLTKADIDGDAIKAVMLFSDSSKKEARSLIVTTQKFTHELMKGHKDRADMAKSVFDSISGRTFAIGKNYEEFAQHSFLLGKDAAYAAFFTKAYTGSMNAASIKIKNLLEDALGTGRVKDKEKLFETLAWSRTLPSMTLEQPIISSKHLSRVITDGLANSTLGKTNSERMLNSIKGLTNEDMLGILKESEGTLDPMLQMAAAEAYSDTARRGVMLGEDGALKHVSTLMDYEYNWRTMNDEDFKLMRSTKGAQMTDEQYTAWTEGVRKHQTLHTPMAERGVIENTVLHNKSMLDITTEAKNSVGDNLFEVMKRAEKDANKLFGGLDKPEAKNYINDLLYANMRAVFSPGDEMLGFEHLNRIPKASRQLIGWNKVSKYVDKFSDWVKEAPAQRLGGSAIVGLAAIAATNLIFGDGTPTNMSDLPSVNNPNFGGNRGSIGGNGIISSRSNYNMSNTLLSDSSNNLGSIHSSLNSLVRQQGHNVVSVRHDNTDPYLDKMSYYR